MWGNSLRNSNNNYILYKEGWITKWAVGQNVNNIADNNFTSDFLLTFEPKHLTGLKFIEHITDKNQHITE